MSVPGSGRRRDDRTFQRYAQVAAANGLFTQTHGHQTLLQDLSLEEHQQLAAGRVPPYRPASCIDPSDPAYRVLHMRTGAPHSWSIGLVQELPKDAAGLIGTPAAGYRWSQMVIEIKHPAAARPHLFLITFTTPSTVYHAGQVMQQPWHHHTILHLPPGYTVHITDHDGWSGPDSHEVHFQAPGVVITRVVKTEGGAIKLVSMTVADALMWQQSSVVMPSNVVAPVQTCSEMPGMQALVDFLRPGIAEPMVGAGARAAAAAAPEVVGGDPVVGGGSSSSASSASAGWPAAVAVHAPSSSTSSGQACAAGTACRNAGGRRVWHTCQQCHSSMCSSDCMMAHHEHHHRACEQAEAAAQARQLAVPCCATCGSIQGALKRCGQCHIVLYCNRSCQRQHWQYHRYPCQAIVKATGGAAPS